jgi:hypothetical protein
MAMRPEPNVKVFTSDTTNSSILQNTITTALVIKSSMGINTPQFVVNQADLLEKYSSKGFVSSDDDITFKSAYYLLGFTPLWLCRVSSDSITSGITNTGEVVFKDVSENNSLYSINTQISLEDSSDGKFNLYIKTAQGNVYYCGATVPTILGTKIKLSDSKLSSEEFISLLIATSTESIIYNRTSKEYQFISPPSDKVTEVSSNYLIKTDTSSNFITINMETNKPLTNNDYIILNNTLYYFDDDQSLPPLDDSQASVSKLPLRFPTNSLLSDIYITYLEQELLTKKTGYNSLIKFKLDLASDIDVVISSELSTFIAPDANNSITSKNSIIDTGYIILTKNSISNLFYVGDIEPDFSSTGLTITGYFQFNKNTTLNRLLMGIYETAVFNNPVNDPFDYTDVKVTVSKLQITASSNSIIYESNLPLTVGSISSNVYSVVGLSLDDYNMENKVISQYYLSIDNNIYYIGTQPVVTIPNPVFIKISSTPVLFKDLIDSFIKYIDIDYPVYLDKSGNINILSDEELSISYDNLADITAIKLQTLINLMSKFAIFSKFTTDKSVLSYSILTTEDPEVFSLTVNVKSKQYQYDISFNPDKLDGFGTNLYYTRVNEINPYIEILEINEDGLISNFTSEVYGDEVKSLNVTVDSYIESVNKFGDMEGIKFDIIIPGGYSNIQYIKALVNFGSNIDNYTKVPITMPEYKNIDLMIAYKSDLGVDNWQAQLFCQWFKTTINDFSVTLPMELLYIEKVINNFLAGNEFSPLLGKDTGLVSFKPTVSFNKTQRELLLGNRIVPVKYDRQQNISYFVDNINLTNRESYLSNQENFVRVVNSMAHSTDIVLENFIGKPNSGKAREEVSFKLKDAFTDLGLYKNDFIKGIAIICDDTNNTQSVIDNNELIVEVLIAFNNVIKYIKVFQKVVTTIA